jgi:hypothetical protein
MNCTILAIPTLDDLHQHIHQVLCEHEKLDPATTPLKVAPVRRQNRLCGSFFRVDGPRMVRICAIWAANEGRVLFYDSAGARFAETKLTKSLEVARPAA